MNVTLTVNYDTKTVTVTLPNGEAIEYAKQSDAWAAHPELQPAPPTPAQERKLAAAQRKERASWGKSRSLGGRYS